MSLLSQITCGKRPAPRRCMIHGVQGVGKSTWAATSDHPVFIQTEDGLGEIDCAKFPVARSFADVMAALTELRGEPHDFRTVVVDSLDWLERLIWQEVCVRKNVKNIEDIGFQKGYVFALDEWRMVIDVLDALRRDRGMAIVLIAHTKNGFPWQASIGASVEEFEFVKEHQKTSVNGRSFDGPVNVVRKATLGEISFVDLGADGNTSAQVAAAAQQKEKTIMDANAPATLAAPTATTQPNAQTVTAPAAPVQVAPVQAAATTASDVPRAPAAPLPGPVATSIAASAPVASEKTVDQVRAEALAETNRIAAIRKVCAPAQSGARFTEIEAKAIAEGWDATKTELEVLRASRPVPPAVSSAPGVIVRAEQGAVTAQVLEAACYMSARLEGVDKMFDARVLEAADQRFHRAIGLQELILEAAWANGYTGRGFRDSKAVMQAAFPPVNAAFSTIDIGGILSNVANKFLLEGFFSVERTWRNICAIRNVNDFKTVTSYRLVGADQYEQVSPGGELKHGTLGNETYTNKADTYGLMLAVDRRDIINDDLGAITTVPRKLGRGSGLKINDVFWALFLNNAAFFTAGNKNYLAGAATALGVDALTVAEQTFSDQVDSDGKPIGVLPAILLVPTALSAVGTQLYKSLEIRDTTANTKAPIANPHQGKFRVEVSRYMGNTRYTGSIASYLWSGYAGMSAADLLYDIRNLLQQFTFDGNGRLQVTAS